jgi:hypothetical protein
MLADGQLTSGVTYLFATPTTPGEEGGVLRVSHRRSRETGVVETRANGSVALPTGVQTCFAVVVDEDQRRLSVYVDGRLQSAAELSETLSAINDVNNWLGRSQFEADGPLAGTLHDFRIYADVLTPEQLRESFAAGPDATLDATSDAAVAEAPEQNE